MFNSYDYLAQFYNELMDVDYKNWANYLTKFFKDSDSKVLDLGCGTAKLTNEFFLKGYDVTAVDDSLAMLNIAWNNYNNKFTILNQDMRYLDLKQKFDIIMSNCDVFNYITNTNEFNKVLRNVYNHLEETGKFIFDISSSYKLKEIIGNNTFFEDTDDLTYIWSNELKDDIVNMEITFFQYDNSFVCYKRYDEHHTQRAWKISEIKKMLVGNGFMVEQILDFYSSNAPSDLSERILFITTIK